MTDRFNKYKEADARDVPESSSRDLNQSMETLNFEDLPSTSQVEIPPPTPPPPPTPVVRPVVKQFELKKLVGGFCKFSLLSTILFVRYGSIWYLNQKRHNIIARRASRSTWNFHPKQ